MNNINIVEKHKDREFTAFGNNRGIVLCDKEGGAFIVLRSVNDLSNLKKLLDSIKQYDLAE